MLKSCALLLLAAGSCWGETLLTLQDAMDLALKGNRQVQIGVTDIARAAAATAEAKTARFPQLKTYILAGSTLNPIDFTIPRGALGVYPTVGPIPGADASVSTSPTFAGLIYASAAQPISQLYKIRLAIRGSLLGEELARENVRATRQETVQQVRQAYYQIVQTQSQVASGESALRYLTELSALTDRHLAEETVLKSDSLNVKAKLSQQKYQLLTLHNALDTQKESLNRLLGRDLRTEFSVETQSIPTIEELELAAARKKALEQRPEIRKARLQNRKAELDVRRERAEYLPDISFQLSYLSLAHVNLLPPNIGHAGFVLEWQPFDWGQKRHHMEQLRSVAKEATLTTEDVEQQVLLDVDVRYRKLMEARALVDSIAATQEAEREKLRITTNLYQERAALLTDVLQQQAVVAQADSQYQQAIAGFWNARADFSRALGEEF